MDNSSKGSLVLNNNVEIIEFTTRVKNALTHETFKYSQPLT